MIDFNHILLFIACASPLILLARTWRRGGLNRGWRLAALAVLIVTGLSWILRPETAGFIGGGAWLVLLLVPAIGLRKTTELAGQQRYALARRLACALRFVHPAGDLRAQSDLLRALEFAQEGDFASALALLGTLQDSQTNVGCQAIAQSFRIRGDWSGLLRWIRGELPPGIMQTDWALQPLYLRALGETGARDELLRELTTHARSSDSAPEHVWPFEISLLVVLSFLGRLQSLSKLLETRLGKLPRETKEFWIGTGELVAGETAAGYARLEKLRANARDALIRAESARRLERVNELAPAPPSSASDGLLRRMFLAHEPRARPRQCWASLL
jgi:rhomboid protease GluP